MVQRAEHTVSPANSQSMTGSRNLLTAMSNSSITGRANVPLLLDTEGPGVQQW